MAYDYLIVGAGPAGIFTALQLLRRGSGKSILMLEKGQPLGRRRRGGHRGDRRELLAEVVG